MGISQKLEHYYIEEGFIVSNGSIGPKGDPSKREVLDSIDKIKFKLKQENLRLKKNKDNEKRLLEIKEDEENLFWSKKMFALYYKNND